MVQSPKQRCDRHVQHGELIPQQEFLTGQYLRKLGQVVANDRACLVGRLGHTMLYHFDLAVDLLFEAMQKQPCTAAHDGVGWHQLRMRKTFVYVFVDDVCFIKHQIALHQDRHFAIGIDCRDVLRLVHQIHIDHLEIHAFLEQHDPAAVTIGI